MYDFIGDIHGHASELKKLLLKMGYKKINKTYRHESRKVVFLGDYIDRGKEEEEVISTVRNMVDSGDAMAIMGNHEYNAICFATRDGNNYLRKHSDNNINTHKHFLKEFTPESKKYNDVIGWFKTLPLFLDLGETRAVHACWDNNHIDYLKTQLNCNHTVNDDFIYNSSQKGSNQHDSMEVTLKGYELSLPDSKIWTDSYGINRDTFRVSWFKNHINPTYRDIAVGLPDISVLPDEKVNSFYSYSDNTPVFFGHYWLNGTPEKQSDFLACLDYSVAKKGKLVGYRWSGENRLMNENFIY
jgi:hypothetical protein